MSWLNKLLDLLRQKLPSPGKADRVHSADPGYFVSVWRSDSYGAGRNQPYFLDRTTQRACFRLECRYSSQHGVFAVWFSFYGDNGRIGLSIYR